MYITSPPPDHLKKYIDYFWMGEQESDSSNPFSHLAVASTKVELQFRYLGNFHTIQKEEQQHISSVCFFGQSNGFKYYHATSCKTGIFSVRFHAPALALLFGIPATELTNSIFEIDALLGAQGRALSEQVFDAKTFRDKIAVITKFIEVKVNNEPLKYRHFEKLLEIIKPANGRIDLEYLANETGLSPRQFERNFKELLGFSARSYQKISRFESFVEALSLVQHKKLRTLTQHALDFGFYDQAHLNRQFKEYSGVSPKKYLQLLSQ